MSQPAQFENDEPASPLVWGEFQTVMDALDGALFAANEVDSSRTQFFTARSTGSVHLVPGRWGRADAFGRARTALA